MRYKIIIAGLIFIMTRSVIAQNNIDLILADIAKNNKSIKANNQYWEAKKLLYKTGLAPYNPKIEYEYMPGSPASAGTQTDIFILQQFDFPTAYIKKNQVAKEQIIQSEFQVISYRQTILLSAKQYCIDLIYYNKMQEELNKRLQNAAIVHDFYQLKFTNGDANILDVNKAKLQLIDIKNEVRLNQSKINQLIQKLTELNGGMAIVFTETSYPLTPVLPDFKTLENEIEENDPDLKSIHQQNEIDKKKVALSKAMSLPKLEAGYRSQELLGQTLQGIHLGLTIPLWQNKNSVKHQKAHLFYNDLQIEEHGNEHYYEIQQLYEKYENLNIAITEYQKIIIAVSNVELLDKALELGEISAIQYFMEVNYFNHSFDNYLFLEKEFHQVIAALYKYKL